MDYKIIIPAKGVSTRCPNKNETLLPYMARYLQVEGLMDKAVVISESESMRHLAQSLGFATYTETRTERDDDISACRKVMAESNEELFFMLPLTQPFKHHGLLQEMLGVMDEQTDFVITSHIATDRALFWVDNNQFVVKSVERKGCLCPEYEMVDGTAYLIRKSFIENVTSNYGFWSGRFKTVVNHAPYIDIDTQEDMTKFQFLLDYNRL